MFVCRACWRGARSAPPAAGTADVRLLLSALRNTVAEHRHQARRTVTNQSAPRQDSDARWPSADATASAVDAVDKGPRRETAALEWRVNQHLRYLQDNFKMAEQVQLLLKKDRFEEALLLARKASRDARVTVSWNHLIDYLLSKQRLNAALKLFNEMKKRAQWPDERTYTILFRGCANSSYPERAVSEAVKLFHGMRTSGKVQPSIIHLNAVLETCARAGDVDTMFSVLHAADDHLPADGWTYTIVLNALRHSTETVRPHDGDHHAEEVVDRAEQRRQAVQRAKAVWEVVLAEWKKGKIRVDEQLVCAMGRVLLLGDDDDAAAGGGAKAVFALLEQTMNLPRLDGGNRESPPSAGGSKEADGTGSSKAVSAPTSRKRNAMALAVPGPNTLSLVLTALEKTKETSLVSKCWNVLTRDYGVEPDKQNYHAALRLLRLGASSTKAAELVLQMPTKFASGQAYSYALGACARDPGNVHSFRNATTIFDAMVKNLHSPDVACMSLYLQIARTNTSHFRVSEPAPNTNAASSSPSSSSSSPSSSSSSPSSSSSSPSSSSSSSSSAATVIQLPDGSTVQKQALGLQLVRALDRLWEPYNMLWNSLSYPERPSRSPREEREALAPQRERALALGQDVMNAVSFVVRHAMAPAEVLDVLRTRRDVLARRLQRFRQKTASAAATEGDHTGGGVRRGGPRRGAASVSRGTARSVR